MKKLKIERCYKERCEVLPTIYTSIDDFIDNFPFAERQNNENVQNELNRKGYFIFGDIDCPFYFKLREI